MNIKTTPKFLVRFFQDDGYPPDRSKFMITGCEPTCCLTDKPLYLESDKYNWIEVICLDPEEGMKQIRKELSPMYQDKEYPILRIPEIGTYWFPNV
jgi:hypothetical protein